MKVFHHNDADGICATAVILRHLEQEPEPPSCEFIPIDYTDDFPINAIKKDECVWIVDFSIPVEDMKRLIKVTRDIIWIDHHVSAIEKYVDFNREYFERNGEIPIDGIRTGAYSGCELTWLFLDGRGCHNRYAGDNPKIDESAFDGCPRYIQLTGDRDTWTYKFGAQSRALHEMFKFNGEPGPEHPWWEIISDDEALEEQIDLGIKMIAHSAGIYKGIIDKMAYETEWEGHRILVCNSPIFSSELFGDRIDDYPFVAVYCHTGRNWRTSLYSTKMDVRHLAEKHGGGGHPRACGFVADDVPFKEVKDE